MQQILLDFTLKNCIINNIDPVIFEFINYHLDTFFILDIVDVKFFIIFFMILNAIKAHHSRRLLTILILTHSYNLLVIVIAHLASVYPKHFIKIITNKLLFYLLFNENFISNLFIIYIEEFILSSFGRFIRLYEKKNTKIFYIRFKFRF